MKRRQLIIKKYGAPLDQADIDANNNKYVIAHDGKLTFGSPSPDLSGYNPLYFDRAGTVITPHTAGNVLDITTITTASTAIVYSGNFVDTLTVGSRVITFINDGVKYTSWSDTVNTWTPTYTGGKITGVTVT